MLLLDQPYVSPFLRQTILEHKLPVIDTPAVRDLGLDARTELLDETTAVQALQSTRPSRLYSNSENTLGWIARNLPASDLARQVGLLKDKVRFRELLAPLYPDFFYTAVPAADLARLDPTALPLPFIIKPAVGFFSMGVHKVSSAMEWPGILAALQTGLAKIAAVFPQQVLDATTFIVEACAAGDEYAIDAYYDSDGKAVIVNVLQHPFASATDVSDRAYISSAAIIRRTLDRFTGLLDEIGALAGLRDFPLHAEVRLAADGTITPIELNPLRFGGWCATDISHYAFGIDPYLTFLRGDRPSWDGILAAKGDQITGQIVLERGLAQDGQSVQGFDARRLMSCFTRPLEWRPIDFRRYPVFGFLFVETSDGDMREINGILSSDLREFML